MVRYEKAAAKQVKEEMREFKRGRLKTRGGRKMKSRKQAIAIGLSKARKHGPKVHPPKKRRKK